MKNILGYLGLFGFVGILGIITENRGIIAFFAYFVFFRYFFIRPDELFKLNVQRAVTPSFFTAVTVQVLTIVVSILTNNTTLLLKGLAMSFSIPVALFIVILVISEFRESRGCSHGN